MNAHMPTCACSYSVTSNFLDPNSNHENNVKCTWYVIREWDTKYASLRISEIPE